MSENELKSDMLMHTGTISYNLRQFITSCYNSEIKPLKVVIKCCC